MEMQGFSGICGLQLQEKQKTVVTLLFVVLYMLNKLIDDILTTV